MFFKECHPDYVEQHVNFPPKKTKGSAEVDNATLLDSGEVTVPDNVNISSEDDDTKDEIERLQRQLREIEEKLRNSSTISALEEVGQEDADSYVEACAPLANGHVHEAQMPWLTVDETREDDIIDVHLPDSISENNFGNQVKQTGASVTSTQSLQPSSSLNVSSKLNNHGSSQTSPILPFQSCDIPLSPSIYHQSQSNSPSLVINDSKKPATSLSSLPSTYTSPESTPNPQSSEDEISDSDSVESLLLNSSESAPTRKAAQPFKSSDRVQELKPEPITANSKQFLSNKASQYQQTVQQNANQPTSNADVAPLQSPSYYPSYTENIASSASTLPTSSTAFDSKAGILKAVDGPDKRVHRTPSYSSKEKHIIVPQDGRDFFAASILPPRTATPYALTTDDEPMDHRSTDSPPHSREPTIVPIRQKRQIYFHIHIAKTPAKQDHKCAACTTHVTPGSDRVLLCSLHTHTRCHF